MDEDESQRLQRNAVMVLIGIRAMASRGEITRYGAVVEYMAAHLKKTEVSAAFDLLSDWGLVSGHYGPTGGGRAGYIYEITDLGEMLLQKMEKRVLVEK